MSIENFRKIFLTIYREYHTPHKGGGPAPRRRKSLCINNLRQYLLEKIKTPHVARREKTTRGGGNKKRAGSFRYDHVALLSQTRYRNFSIY